MVENIGFFKGKSVFISGASRGIGLAIALKLARDGAKIAIAAKTVKPDPRLEGTIYTAAKEIEKVGGECLPIQCDIRDDVNTQKAVEAAAEKFGGIDILINNASAISPTTLEKTDMKRYDLMQSINTRGTLLLSKLCIPYLSKSKNPHILNLSPPLDLQAQWFAPHTPYSIAKFGMSLVVLGIHKELEPKGIAVNALWPRTMIWTAAVANILAKNKDAQDICRKPEILADAAYLMLSKNSKDFTGNFIIDDDFLKENGVKDIDQYAYKPGHKLQLDFFIPGAKYGGFI